MKIRLTPVLALFLPFVGQIMAAAWPAEFYIMTERRALSLMPTALKDILDEHKKDVFAGIQNTIDHHPFQSVDGEINRIREKMEQAAHLVRSRRPLAEFAFAMGEICGLLCEDGSPHVIHPDGCGGPELRKKFFLFTREKLPRFVPSFQVLKRRKLTPEKLGTAVKEMIEEAEKACSKLAAGSIDKNHDWDDQSVQFGVSSLAHTQAILNVASFWLMAWESAGGDMRDAPDWWQNPSEEP